MGRIHDILAKAEREGTTRRTRGVADEYPSPTADESRHARRYSEPPAPRSLTEPGQPRTVEPIEPLTHARPEGPGPSHGGLGHAPPPDSEAGAAGHLDPLLVAALAPRSLAAEQYRSLRTRLKRSENGRVLRTIAITSPSKGDGKSLTAANLALTMAQEYQERVLLVDADLRRPTLHRLFGVAEDPGLADVLMNLAELDQALVTLPEHHLTLLPAGMPPSHPAELLGSTAMRRVMDALRTRFDRVLIDVPPVTPLADLHILAPMVDGMLMIVRAGVTPKPAIERALAGVDASRVVGIVLNETGDPRSSAADYEGYGYIAG